MRVGLDIDGTITANPSYFSALTERVYAEGGSVIVITSRLDIGYNKMITIAELKELSIRHDILHLARPHEEVEDPCPYPDLDLYQQYLWQKVHHAINERLDVFYEDEDKVIELFKSYVPDIEIIDAKLIK